MKKSFMIGAFALLGVLANAQTEKGSWIVGGSTTLGFNNVTTKTKVNGQSYDGPKVSTFGITPSVGYFVADKIAVGLDLGFSSTTSKSEEENVTNKTTMSTISAIPTVTYYFKSDSKVIPYLGAGVGYESTTTKYSGSNYNNKATFDGFAWKAKGGIMYMVSSNIGIDLGVSYAQFSHNEKEDNVTAKTKVNNLGVNAGLAVFFK